MHGLNMYDYSARYYEPAIGRFTTVDPLAEKYYSISPYVYVGNNPIKFIDPDGRAFGPPDEPINLRISPRMTKISQAAQRVSKSGSQVFSGTQISISGSAYSVGGEIRVSGIGKLKGNVGVGNIEGKLSTERLTGTASALELGGEASLQNIVSAKANMTLGEAEVSIDKNLNIDGKIDIGSAGAKVQVGNQANLSVISTGKVELGAKISILKAKVAVNMEALANYLSGIAEAIGSAILPESLSKPISDDNIDKLNTK